MTSATQPDQQAEIENQMATMRRWSTLLTVARVASYLAYAWVLVSLVILAFGFFLLLFAANPDAPFTEWVYRHLTDTMEPFRGIFPQQTTDGGSTLDVSILFAMFVYTLIALGVRSVIDWLTYRRDRVARQLQRDQEFLRRSRAGQGTPRRDATLDVSVSERERQAPPEW